MKIKHIYLLASIALLCYSCQKDVISSETTEVTVGPIEVIESSVSGLVTDQEGNALADVSVQYKGDFLKTDENGYFKIEDAPAVYDGGLLKFKQEGYFKNYKWFYPQLGDNAFVRVTMVKEIEVGEVTNSSGGTVILNGGAKVTFPPAAFLSPEETFTVYAYWYDPTGTALTEEMPGDLRAIDTDEALVQLATYGMVVVEIRDANGNDIQLANDTLDSNVLPKLATIEFPLPQELKENAAETIKTWSFDEDRAYWKEEGLAKLVGDTYVAEVSHFSFWNCDAPFPIIHVTGRLATKDGINLSGVKICITDLDRANTRSGWTSANGRFSGKVPKDTPLKLIAKDECNGTIYASEIGPLSDDTDLGDIIVETENFLEVTGRLICDGQPASNGYALLSFTTGVQFVAEVNDEGLFEFNLPFCDEGKVSVLGYNTETNSKSEWQIFTDFELSLSTGDIEICEGDLDEYIKYKMNSGVELFLVTPEARLINSQLRILDSNAQNDNVTLLLDNPQAGDVVVKRIAAGQAASGLSGVCGNTNPSESACDLVTCTIYDPYEPNEGNYIEGEFMGSLESPNGEPIEIMGSFRVQLDQVLNESLISGYVWNDSNNDGIRDDLDQGQTPPNFSRVTLHRDGVATESVATSPGDGYYSFRAEAGDYQLNFSRPTGYVFVSQGQGTNTAIDSDVDTDGNTVLFTVDGTSEYSYDAGLFWDGNIDCNPATVRNASCGNSNGSYSLNIGTTDSLEWDGYILETYNDGEIFGSIDFFPWVAVEDLQEGAYSYRLINEQGDLICEEDFNIENSGLDCNIASFVDCEGPNYIGSIEADCISNGDFEIAWEDGQVGQYFDVPAPGTYTITITDSSGCTGEFTVDFFGFPEAAVQGTVWVDTIIGNDNIYDFPLERTLQGVTVSLYDSSGNLLETTTTNANGAYNFTLQEGEYQIGIEVPDGYELLPYMDPDDPNAAFDSDINPDTFLSDPFEIIGCDDWVEILIGLKQ